MLLVPRYYPHVANRIGAQIKNIRSPGRTDAHFDLAVKRILM